MGYDERKLAVDHKNPSYDSDEDGVVDDAETLNGNYPLKNSDLNNSSLQIAGKNVSLGGSTPVASTDLSDSGSIDAYTLQGNQPSDLEETLDQQTLIRENGETKINTDIYYLPIFDLSELSFNFSASINEISDTSGISIDENEKKIYTTEGSSKIIVSSYTGNDISTLSFDYSVTLSYNVESVLIKNGGSKAFVLNGLDNELYEYSLSTNYDFRTRTQENKITVASGDYPKDIKFSNDGKSLFVGTITNQEIIEYSLNNSLSLNTVTKVNSISLSYSVNGIGFSDKGSKLFTADQSNNIREYDLDNNFSISNRTQTNTLNISHQAVSIQWLEDGIELIIPSSTTIESFRGVNK